MLSILLGGLARGAGSLSFLRGGLPAVTGVVGSLALLAPSVAAQLPTATAQYREVEQVFTAEGVLEAVRQSTVSAQVAGRVIDIKFDVGDRVKQGELIMRIDEHELSHALASREAEVVQSRANLQNASAQYERAKALFEQKFVSGAALDKARADYRAARAQVTVTLESAGQAAATKDYASIFAPYSGVVSQRHVEVGEMAALGKPLMTGFDPKDMRALVSVPQYKLQAVDSKRPARVELPALDKTVQAKSMTLVPTADAGTHTTRVRLDLPSDIAGAYPGMFVRAQFVVGRAQRLVVPASAIARRSEITAVYVVKGNGDFGLRQVRLGEAAGQDGVEVLAGLQPGERVALDPIKAGIAVKQGKPSVVEH